MNVKRLVLYICVLWLLVGCSQLPLPGQTPVPTASPPGVTPTATESEQVSTPAPEPLTINIWVPPQFDPEAGTPASNLFKARLQEYRSQNPGLQVEVRVKATQGIGGLLPSLSAAHAAAPLALPDLIALPRADLEEAAIKGYLQPIDPLSPILTEEDWYEYATQLVIVGEDNFGIPFAGDALILIYRPSQIGDPPQDFNAALDLTDPLSFPAAAPEALFPLALYLSTGGNIQNSEGRPTLEVSRLTDILTFFQNAQQTGLMPFWLTQFDTDDLALEAFQDNRAQLAVTWASRHLIDPPIDTVAAALPTANGNPYTLARGWMWAVSSPDPDRQLASVKLAEFLSEESYLGQWTALAGYLPTRSSALASWPSSPLRALISQLVLSAEIVPGTEFTTVLSPALQEATIQVLKQQLDPDSAAKEAANRVTTP